MGTQYQYWNEDKKEYIDAQTLVWDSKFRINCTGSFSKLLIYLMHTRWRADKIVVIATEHWSDADEFYKVNVDVTKIAFLNYVEEFGTDLHGSEVKKNV